MVDCWFAGFFLGDGTIDKLNKGCLHLSKKDIHLLDFVAKQFGFSPTRVKQTHKSCRLNFSKGFIRNLQKVFDIRQNKSYGDVVFPEFLTQMQMKCFLVGLLYSDGNVKIQISNNHTQFAIRFLASFQFCQKLFKWIQENAKLYLHYNQNSVTRLQTKTPYYDVVCLELAGSDSVKFVRWLVEGNQSVLPPLERKMLRIFEVDIQNVREIQKIPIEQSFQNRTKKKWTDQEKTNIKNFILENPTVTDELIGHHFSRSAKAIGHQRRKLGFLKKIENTTVTISKNYSLRYTAE